MVVHEFIGGKYCRGSFALIQPSINKKGHPKLLDGL